MPTKTPLTPQERAERDAAETRDNSAARHITEGESKRSPDRTNHRFVGQAKFDADDRGTPNYIGSR